MTKCDKCGGELKVIRFRKGPKRISTTYKCLQCRSTHAEWHTDEEDHSK